MIPQIMLVQNEKPLLDDGMLFVRTNGILNTMIKVPLILVGLIFMILVIPFQTSFGSTRTLELIIYPDGSTHVSTQIDVDPLEPDFEINLFGESINNFVAVGDTGFLLSEEIIKNKAIIDKFGSSSITVNYDIHDLISKQGRVWTFSFESPSDYTLLMPKNSVIVGMSGLPNNMELIGEHTKLNLSAGMFEINYIFTPTNPPDSSIKDQYDSNYFAIIVIFSSIILAAIYFVFLKRKKSKFSTLIKPELISGKQTETKSIDTETIFNFRPDMREDDKEIVKFISKNGGQVFESELRKKFLQPRTTMWRAVKRLERLGVIEINKKDLQNLVKLKMDLEEEK